MSAYVDTNVLVRHLTQDAPEQARRATLFLATAARLELTDVVFAETVYVLQSVYRASREQVVAAMRGVLAFRSIEVENPAVLVRAIDVYEQSRIDFADAYLVAVAERSGTRMIASFDRSLDRVENVTRVEP